jgi:hypothetical protein
MDYKTKGISRLELRKMAKAFDVMVGTENQMYKPVVELLDRLPDIMSNVYYEVVDDFAFELNVPARGYFNNEGNYIIQIKNYVYEGAIEGIGAYRGFIMHEIFHPYMIKMGFVPLLERNFKDGELYYYESVEWQVKAITGEYMMDFEATKNLSKQEIIEMCGVSKGFARKRKRY